MKKVFKKFPELKKRDHDKVHATIEEEGEERHRSWPPHQPPPW
jgi:hypothetical protein